jgi:hypothetical protein
MLKKFTGIILLLSGLWSCGDDPITPPPVTGPQQYGVPLVSVPSTEQATIYEVNLMTNQNETVGTSFSLTPYSYRIYQIN